MCMFVKPVCGMKLFGIALVFSKYVLSCSPCTTEYLVPLCIVTPIQFAEWMDESGL